MAKTDSIHGAVSGRVGPVVYYRLPGSEKLIVRSSPVINTKARKTHPRFERTRQENREFKGCVKAAGSIAEAVYPVKALGDFNSFGQLVRVCKFIQQADRSRPKGERALLLSLSHSLLDGFSFNKYHRFETLVSSPLSFSIDRQNGSLLAIIPPMRPGIHLFNPAGQPYYRIVVCLGMLCDLFLSANSHFYETAGNEDPACVKGSGDWMNCKDPFPGAEFSLQVPGWTDLPHRTLITGIGIEFGRTVPGGEIASVKYAGAGKIWVTG